ncbi:TadE family protein [Thiorhodococcus minor]|uniref:Pilus assembly protein n=1 Tax=Thiorhodococcus minor TaxID=57489 RepID=A0A6M0K121_9GAMM|nr:pilus assembly protein [Thiorhodococcus minor]
MKAHSSRKKQRGNEIVEFTLLAPWLIFFALIFVELGVAYSDKSIVLEASRVGAREAISGNADWKDSVNAVLASSIPWGRAAYVCANGNDCDAVQNDCCCGVSDSDPEVGDRVIATIDCPFQFVAIPDFLLSSSLREEMSLRAQTGMRALVD